MGRIRKAILAGVCAGIAAALGFMGDGVTAQEIGEAVAIAITAGAGTWRIPNAKPLRSYLDD